MPRRYAHYLPTDGFTTMHTISTIGSFVLGAATFRSCTTPGTRGTTAFSHSGTTRGHGNSLEWATSSPPPRHNVVALPRIRSERPAFEMHYPHLLERLQAEAHAGRRYEPYASELVGGTGPRQGPQDPDPT
ncbi:MAG: ctaD [Blastococcus sp.]|nr:ctaD [Blastococcus sp.]